MHIERKCSTNGYLQEAWVDRVTDPKTISVVKKEFVDDLVKKMLDWDMKPALAEEHMQGFNAWCDAQNGKSSALISDA